MLSVIFGTKSYTVRKYFLGSDSRTDVMLAQRLRNVHSVKFNVTSFKIVAKSRRKDRQHVVCLPFINYH